MQRLLENINDSHATASDHQYTALVPSQHVNKWQKRLDNIKVIGADQKWYSFAEQLSLYRQLRQLKPDLVHFTMPQQPLLWRGPAITTIHDVTLIRFDNVRPGESTLVYKFKKQVFHALLRVVMRRAQAILTPTEFVRQDLADFFGRKYINKIHATPLAGEIPDETPTPIAKYEGRKFLLALGNGFPYKNVWRVIDGFRQLKQKHPDLHLLVAGKKDEFYLELEKRAKSEGITEAHFLGFISDGEKRWAYQNAAAYVTASYSEGFCMPVLEAMIEGCPVVASNVSCLPEVVGDAGVLFNPDSTESLVAALEPVLTDESLRTELINKGTAHASSYSWPRMVSQAVGVYEVALKSSLEK